MRPGNSDPMTPIQLSCILRLATAWLLVSAVALGHTTNDESLIRSAHDDTISEPLFHSLAELARIVDISYCVGNTGIHKPFQCLGRCSEFDGFELIKVCT